MKIRNMGIVAILMLSAVTSFGQNPRRSQDDLKRCIPKSIGHKTPIPHIHFRPGEKYVGIPIVTLEILPSGEVSNVKVKRTSGVHDIDALAVDWVQSFKYNKRPGCPVFENQAGVTIDFTGG